MTTSKYLYSTLYKVFSELPLNSRQLIIMIQNEFIGCVHIYSRYHNYAGLGTSANASFLKEN